MTTYRISKLYHFDLYKPCQTEEFSPWIARASKKFLWFTGVSLDNRHQSCFESCQLTRNDVTSARNLFFSQGPAMHGENCSCKSIKRVLHWTLEQCHWSQAQEKWSEVVPEAKAAPSVTWLSQAVIPEKYTRHPNKMPLQGTDVHMSLWCICKCNERKVDFQKTWCVTQTAHLKLCGHQTSIFVVNPLYPCKETYSTRLTAWG